MSNGNFKPSLGPLFTMSAVGATLAMLVLPISVIIMMTTRWIDRDLMIVLSILTWIGYLLWSIGLFCLCPRMKANGFYEGRTVLTGIAVLLSLIVPAIVGFVRIRQDEAIVIYILLVILQLLTAVGTVGLCKYFKGATVAATGHWMTFIASVLYFLFPLILKWREVETGLIVAGVLFALGMITAVIGWWLISTSASAHDRHVREQLNPAPEVTTAPEQQYQQYQPQQPSFVDNTRYAPPAGYQAPAPQAPANITEQQRDMLLAYDDRQLQAVIDNPQLYANPAFVAEAREILNRRQAWESIKDYEDRQLYDIVHAPENTFTDAVMEAASMELYSRQSPLLFDELSALPRTELLQITSPNAPFFEGYILAARDILARS